MTALDLNNYLGTWYELMHYPSWFQRNDNYNTTAEYTLENVNGQKVIRVHNSTITQGKRFDSIGIGRYLGGYNFRVDFPMGEVAKLQQSGEFKGYRSDTNNNIPNYVVEKLWTNAYGQLMRCSFATS
ncbi:Hypothetical protein HVR_LOCUS971 [uncultured virus]|nr:Hypothetical protein HVR_LOCUS971 [uncultured virus]